jgi:hypothetical protein
VSYTDPSAVDVQPEGQGDEGTGNPAYAEYLTRIPEEARGAAEEAFRDWDARTTQRFQEAAELRKTWEPYQEAGVTRYDPAAVQWALSFMEASQANPAAVKDWYETYAKENGLQSAAPPPPQAEYPTLDEYGGYQDQGLETTLKSALEPIQTQLEALTRFREQAEAQQAEAEAKQFVEGQMAELRDKNPDAFKDSGPYGAEQMVNRLLPHYIDADPLNAVPRAFADYQAIVGQVEKNTLQSKVDAAPPPVGGGAINGAPEEIKTLADASERARAALQQSFNQ